MAGSTNRDTSTCEPPRRLTRSGSWASPGETGLSASGSTLLRPQRPEDLVEVGQRLATCRLHPGQQVAAETRIAVEHDARCARLDDHEVHRVPDDVVQLACHPGVLLGDHLPPDGALGAPLLLATSGQAVAESPRHEPDEQHADWFGGVLRSAAGEVDQDAGRDDRAAPRASASGSRRSRRSRPANWSPYGEIGLVTSRSDSVHSATVATMKADIG